MTYYKEALSQLYKLYIRYYPMHKYKWVIGYIDIVPGDPRKSRPLLGEKYSTTKSIAKLMYRMCEDGENTSTTVLKVSLYVQHLYARELKGQLRGTESLAKKLFWIANEDR
jgi:hypothetical protein